MKACAPDRRQLYASGAPKADGHTAVFDDDRDTALAFAVLEHQREARRILLDVHELERNLPPLIVVTGGLRVRSRVLAEDEHHRFHCTRAAKSRATIRSHLGD